ncbi:hypothetical protein HY480_01150 [Candidatus Uhrbacteria bacterium]|nr:hypothetical protein [Candidatus Uhrbacteria bacterium]
MMYEPKRTPRRLTPELALRIALVKEQRKRERKHRQRTQPLTDRERTVIAMVQSRCTYREIGNALGVTPSRVRLIAERIRRNHGKGALLAPDQQFWMLAEAARDLGVSLDTIRRICSRGDVSCFWRGAEGGQYLITDDGMEQLRAEPSIARKGTCVICGAPFAKVSRSAWRRSTCAAPVCGKEWRRTTQQRTIAKAPTEESLTGWTRAAFRALQRHRPPIDRTEWVTRSEVIRRTGLSSMRVQWLRLRRVLTVRPHPTRKGRSGRPVATFAASEIAIVAKAYAAYQKRQTRGRS